MSENVLELKDLSIAYQGKEAVHSVSFNVPKGAVVAIVGESGSGKSTVIRAAIGLLSAGGEVVGGKIIFDGKDLKDYSGEELRKMRGEKIAMIFQDAGAYLNPRLKIGKQYIETLQAHKSISKEDAEKIAHEMLLKLKLADTKRIMNSYPFELSGGMKQRVGIAMAISLKPQLLLADEPTSALDVTVQAQVVQEMINLKNEIGASIIIVTHNMGVASHMADFIAVMRKGVLVEFGEREQVIDSPQHEYTKMLLSVVPELEDTASE